jgi:uncharacterized protein (TIGR02246 family)
MTNDEQAIRELVDRWMAATKTGDVETVLSLMTDDVVFSVPGREPFGKAEFAKSAVGLSNMQMEGSSEIVELEVIGTWAFIRNRISLKMTMPDGDEKHRSGYTLTLLRKGADDQWRLARDANLVTPD